MDISYGRTYPELVRFTLDRYSNEVTHLIKLLSQTQLSGTCWEIVWLWDRCPQFKKLICDQITWTPWTPEEFRIEAQLKEDLTLNSHQLSSEAQQYLSMIYPHRTKDIQNSYLSKNTHLEIETWSDW